MGITTTSTQFKQGKLTSNTINRQFTPEFVTKAIVTMPKRKAFFGKLANRLRMPKNHGDVFTQEIRYPITHKGNMLDANVDATHRARLLQNVWYRVKQDKTYENTNFGEYTLMGTYDAKDYIKAAAAAKSIDLDSKDLTQKDRDDLMDEAIVKAKQAATDALETGEVLKSGAGNILNGDADYSISAAPYAEIPEEGGMMNEVNSTSKLVSAKMSFHGLHTKYTVRSHDLDSRVGLLARKVADLSEHVAAAKEAQIQNSLLSQAAAHTMFPEGVTALSGLGKDTVLTYDMLQAFELELQRDDVPMDTEMLTGVDLQDTVTVSDAYIMYVNREVVPTLRKLTDSKGDFVWSPKEKYAAGTTLLDGEAGKILSFRFVVVPDLQVQRGYGANSTPEDAAGYYAVTGEDPSTSGKEKAFDVFSGLVIGADSFTVASYGGMNTSAKHIPPREDVYNDIYAQVGGIAAKWTYGFLAYRPERIKRLAFTVKKNG